MKSKLNPPYLRNLSLRSLNEVLIEIYRALNIISDSANEVTFRKTETGAKELVINDKGKKYIDTSKNASFDADLSALKTKNKNDLKKELLLDNVDNESKATMFTNPSFTGDSKISTSVANELRVGHVNQADNHLVVYAPLDNSGMLVFRDSVYNRWAIGYRHGSNTVLRINPSKTVASDDVLQLTDAGNLTIDGDLAVNGGDATITAGEAGTASLLLQADESDDNGDDWKILNSALTNDLSFSNDISGSYVPQISINSNATLASGTTTIYTQLKLNTEIAATSSAKIAVLDSGVFKYRTGIQVLEDAGGNIHYMTHNFDYTGTAGTYIPFGGSQTSTGLTSSATDDETVFIAPANGKLLKLHFQSVTAAGDSRALLRVNGTDGTGGAVVDCSSADTTYTLVINSGSNSFTAGDRIRVKFDPTSAPDEIAMTSVWEFTKT